MATTEGPEGPPFPRIAEYGDVRWNGYITVTTAALARRPRFITASVNKSSEPLATGSCRPQVCPRVGDFVDSVIGPDGTARASFVSQQTGEVLVGRLLGGPKLR